MSWKVPLTELTVPEEDVEAVMDCLRSGWLTMGPRTAAFEDAFADWLGTPFAVSVSSGTAGLHLALAALGIGPGDEVIVPGFTFVATAAAVRYVGGDPVLCDVTSAHEPLIDPDAVAALITERTKAVIAVHFLGYDAPILALRELCDAHGLALVEDVAQALGATVDPAGTKAGTVGDLGVFSFFAKAQLSVGEGGMVSTPREELADRVRLLRSHAMTSGTWDRHLGHAATYDVVDVGYNFRLDEARAAFALSRMSRLDADIEARREHARHYRRALRELDVAVPFDDEAVERASHFAFVVLTSDRSERDRLRAVLADDGVQTTWYPAVTQLSFYRGLQKVPKSEDVAARHFALPISASLGAGDRAFVVDSLRAALVATGRA